MSEEQDSWFKDAFGLDLGGALKTIQDEAAAAAAQAAGALATVVDGVQGAVDAAIDGAAGAIGGAVKKVAGAAGLGGAGGAAPPAAGGAGRFPLRGSVGRGGRNGADDVRAVQAALGIPADGRCGPVTIAAIEAFQRNRGLPTADGRVDPGGATERALTGGGARPPAAAQGAGGSPAAAEVVDVQADADPDSGLFGLAPNEVADTGPGSAGTGPSDPPMDIIDQPVEALDTGADSTIVFDPPIGVLPLLQVSASGRGIFVRVEAGSKSNLLFQKATSDPSVGTVRIVQPGGTTVVKDAFITAAQTEAQGRMSLTIESIPRKGGRSEPGKEPRRVSPTLVMGPPIGTMPIESVQFDGSRRNFTLVVSVTGKQGVQLFQAVADGTRFPLVKILVTGGTLVLTQAIVTSFNSTGDGSSVSIAISAAEPAKFEEAK